MNSEKIPGPTQRHRSCLLDQKSISGERTGALVLEGNLVSIDTYWDLDLAEYIHTKGLV